MKVSKSDRAVEWFSYISMSIFAILCIFPFLYVLGYSLMTYDDYLMNPANMIPRHFTLQAYKQLLEFPLMISGFKVTIFITVVGTVLSVFFLMVASYPLSKRNLKGQKYVMMIITFTMFFGGGLIPNYFLMRNLGLLNTVWVLILPSLLSAYNIIVMRTFIRNIPASLEESALMDGANEVTILLRIIIPLSKPAIATFAVFNSVGYWNSFFNAIVYTTERKLWPVMLILRELVIQDGTGQVQGATSAAAGNTYANPFTLKMAAIIITAVPILVVYPFAQKHFAKGVMVGSVKE